MRLEQRIEAIIKVSTPLATFLDQLMITSASGAAEGDLFATLVRRTRTPSKPRADDLPPLSAGFKMDPRLPIPPGRTLDARP